MPRTKVVIWEYECDALTCGEQGPEGPGILPVSRGEVCSTARGTVVHDQADADAHARTLGWQLTHGGRQVFCPGCTGRGR